MVAMGGRHLFALASGIIVARGLGPDKFGTFAFLLTGFASLHVVFDFGTSQAFYTITCREARSSRFFALYGGWIALQFAIPFAAIWMMLPHAWFEEIWHGAPRTLVLMALAASFSQRVLWQMMTQIGEAHRRTAQVQLGTMGIQALHLAVVWALHAANLLSIELLFIVIGMEFVGATIVALALTARRSAEEPIASDDSVGAILREFARYSGPLVVPAVLGAMAAYIETWMLQTFGGPEQQAYYNIAFQYANLAHVFGMSASNVFWKEIAVAHARGDRARMWQIYTNGTRILFSMSALVAGFVVYWSTPALVLLIGPAYADAGPVFVLTLLNSTVACYGIVVGAAYLATGRTRLWSLFGLSYVAASLPTGIFVLWGLRLGALGLSAKVLALTVVFQLFYDFYMCRLNGWKMDYRFRVAVGVFLFAAGGLASASTRWFLPGVAISLQLAAALASYLLVAALGGLVLMRRQAILVR
ncbi:MAG TPA: lipopolysaccharide biosynthesis protein [Stellaceae bacterium]|nr:lipopolysaccharide biosynthesis protein [Stellaceae bacterium]